MKKQRTATKVATENLPIGKNPLKLSAYDPKTFWKIDWKALPVDAMFILFGILFAKGYFAQDNILHSLSRKTILGLYLIVVISVCWYLGFLMARYKTYYGVFTGKLVRVIFSIAGITLLGYMMAILIPMMEDSNAGKGGMQLSMFATFLLVLGPFIGIGGYMTGGQVAEAESEGKPYEGGSDEIFYGIIFALMIAVAFLVKTATSDIVQHSSFGGLWVVILFLLAGVVAAAAIAFLMGVKKVLVSFGLYYKLAFIFETLFPCLVIASLIFWNEIQKVYMSGMSGTAVIGVLFFTGVLPFRLTLIFNPPLRFINMLIGIASLVFYILCML